MCASVCMHVWMFTYSAGEVRIDPAPASLATEHNKHYNGRTNQPTKQPNKKVTAELLSELVEQPFYDELRTQQQLGYLVFSGG